MIEVEELYYKRKQGLYSVILKTKNEKYEEVFCKYNVRVHPQKCINLKKVFVKNTHLNREEFHELREEISNNPTLPEFAYNKALNRLESLSFSQKLNVKEVFVLSADTSYIRKVLRNGPNLRNIQELPMERHKVILKAVLGEFEEEVEMKVEYSDSTGYTLSVRGPHAETIRNIPEDSYVTLTSDVVELMKKKVHFLLP